MTGLVLALLLGILAALAVEQRRVLRARKALSHVVYVNGIQGNPRSPASLTQAFAAADEKCFAKLQVPSP